MTYIDSDLITSPFITTSSSTAVCMSTMLLPSQNTYYGDQKTWILIPMAAWHVFAVLLLDIKRLVDCIIVFSKLSTQFIRYNTMAMFQTIQMESNRLNLFEKRM